MNYRPPIYLQALAVYTALFGSITLLSVVAAVRERPQPDEQKSRGSATIKLRNIQVLKDVPPDQMIPVMRKISASVGERCEFCHVRGKRHPDFASDANPTKKVAREMMTMTADLNKKETILGRQLTCYTCHHGHPEPESQAPMPHK